MPAMPTLFDPSGLRARDVPLRGARVWELELRGSGVDMRLLPDLSQDLLWYGPSDGVPVLSARTIRSEVVPHDGPPAGGLRLPPEAVDIELDITWSGWATAIGPGLLQAPTPGELVEWAVHSGAITWRDDPLRAQTLAALDVPEVRLSDVIEVLGLPERTLRRRTVEWFGLTPVQVVRVLRLRRFMLGLRGGSFAGAAADAGFADQPHAAREVRSLASVTTRELARLHLAD